MHSNPFISPGTLEHDVSVGALLKFGWQVRIKLIWYKPKQRFWTDVWSSHRLTSWYPYKAVFPFSRIRILSLPSLTMFDCYALTLVQIHRLWLLKGVGCFRAEKFEESLEPTRGFHSFTGFRGCWLPGYAWVQAQVETWEFHLKRRMHCWWIQLNLASKDVRACETKHHWSLQSLQVYEYAVLT